MNYRIKLECTHDKTDDSFRVQPHTSAFLQQHITIEKKLFSYCHSLCSHHFEILLLNIMDCHYQTQTDMQIHIYPTHRFIRLLVLINKLLLIELFLFITSNCLVMMAFSMPSLTSVKILMTVCLQRKFFILQTNMLTRHSSAAIRVRRCSWAIQPPHIQMVTFQYHMFLSFFTAIYNLSLSMRAEKKKIKTQFQSSWKLAALSPLFFL